MSVNEHYDNYELELRLKAIVSLLHNAERQGLRISKAVQNVIEHECISLFEHNHVPMDQLRFAALLKDTAVRLFRQRRYVEANCRYRMASLFNPRDVTLISNRATCMYNLKRYERCIDLCHACMMSFPTLCYENTSLYLKLIVRLGHAKIELRNYADARKTYRSLSNLRKHLDVKCGIDIDDEEFQAMTMPFQRHLEDAIETYQKRNPGKSISDLSKRQTPYELGLNGYLRENTKVCIDIDPEEYVDEILHHGDESDDGEEMDGVFNDNTVGTIEIGDLCSHVWTEGKGRCQHMFPEEEHVKNGASYQQKGRTKDDSDTSLGDGDDDDGGDDYDHDAGGSRTDEDMPDLLTCDQDDDDSETDDNSESSGERDALRNYRVQSAKTAPGKKTETFDNRKTKGRNSRVVSGKCSQPDSTTIGKESLADALEKKRNSHVTLAKGLTSHGRQQPTSQRQGFKKGFLNASGHAASRDETAKEVVSSMSSLGSAGPPSPASAPSSMVLYETDEEGGSINGMCSSGTVEDAISGAKKIFPLLQDDGVDHLAELACDVLGQKFNSSVAVDAVDFTELFGGHHVLVKSRKKKKRGCDKRCGPCFARKMWKLRFTNRIVDDFHCFFHRLNEDPRVDQDTFLGNDLWQGVGYYGSGHELAFEIPAIVHGVAYIALLQSELRWRGDSFPSSMDIQQVFLGALERHLTRSQKGLNNLFMILFMLRDTLTLFDMLSDHRSRGLPGSFQFVKTPLQVARSVRESSSPTASDAEREASLMTRCDDCIQNMNNWGVLGHVEREEIWMYKFLLKDVSSLLIDITSRITASPKPSEQTETFTEAFRRLCGDRNDDESQWKHRIVSAICKQRCRVIERKSASRKAIDLNRSAMLLTRGIAARPNQPRLYYKRADVFAHQAKWGDCIRDLRKTRMLLGEQITVKQTIELLDPPQKLLLLHTYTLEGEAHGAQGRDPGRDQRSHVRFGIELFSKALEITPKSKRTKASLQKKLRALQSLEDGLSKVTRSTSVRNRDSREATGSSPAIDTSSGRTPSTSMVADSRMSGTAHEGFVNQSVSTRQDTSDSSSEEETGDQVIGNPYAALLESGASSSSQSAAGPSRHPRSCELCNVVFSSEADYSSHINGKRHKSMVGKARKRGVLPKTSGTYSAPESQRGPTRNEVVEQACRIIGSQGGQAKLSEIMNRLNFGRWNIYDADKYVEETFGGMVSVCVEFSHLFQVGAGSSADPMLRLRNAGPTAAGPARPNRMQAGKTTVSHAIPKGKVRLSETGDFSQMVTDLLQIENDKETKIKSDEDECGICLDNEPDVRCWPCGHVWCDPCMKLYLAKKGTKKGVECPKCRGTIETLHRITVD